MTAAEIQHLDDLWQLKAESDNRADKAFEDCLDVHANFYRSKASEARAEIHRRCLEALAIGAVCGS